MYKKEIVLNNNTIFVNVGDGVIIERGNGAKVFLLNDFFKRKIFVKFKEEKGFSFLFYNDMYYVNFINSNYFYKIGKTVRLSQQPFNKIPGRVICFLNDKVWVKGRSGEFGIETDDGLFVVSDNKVGRLFFANDDYVYYTRLADFSKLMKWDFLRKNKQIIFDASSYKWQDREGKINDDGTILHFEFIKEDYIFLHLATNRLLYFNLKTKEIVWEIDDFIDDSEINKYIYCSPLSRSTMSWHYDETTNEIHFLSRFFYWKIDVFSGESVLMKSYLDVSLEERWSFGRTRKVGDYIYFDGSKGYSYFSNIIGAFCIKTMEVVWSYTSIDDGYFFYPPEVNGDYLFADDSNNKLHIFKKIGDELTPTTE